MSKIEDKRTLIKETEQKYILELVQLEGKMTTRREFSKTQLKDQFKEIEMYKRAALTEKTRLEKEIAKLSELDDNEEIRKILDLMEVALKLKGKAELEEKLEAVKKDILLYFDQAREIEGAIPEVRRSKK